MSVATSIPAGVPVAPPAAAWQRGADRLAQSVWFLLLGVVTGGLAAGAYIAVILRPTYEGTLSEQLYLAQSCGYLAVLALSLPSLAAGLWDWRHGRWAAGGWRVLAFAGPLLVALGAEVGAHLLIPCAQLPWLCDPYLDETGRLVGSITSRWHLLHHTLVAGLPLALVYGYLRGRRAGAPAAPAAHTWAGARS